MIRAILVLFGAGLALAAEIEPGAVPPFESIGQSVFSSLRPALLQAREPSREQNVQSALKADVQRLIGLFELNNVSGIYGTRAVTPRCDELLHLWRNFGWIDPQEGSH